MRQIQAAPALQSWATDSALRPGRVATGLPPFALRGEPLVPEPLTGGGSGGGGSSGGGVGGGPVAQPRRWSVVVLEHALRLTLPVSGPADASDGFSFHEVALPMRKRGTFKKYYLATPQAGTRALSTTLTPAHLV